DQPEFLNGAAEVEWTGDPESQLHTLLAIEQEMGRQRKRHWGERNIDLDLLLFGDQCIHSEDLVLPHPDMANRSFVLEPLAAIAPQAVHPVFHRTIGELWQDLQKKQTRKQE
ncbi:2-amino-4-hydroxy-6-hydroxymethyldihydropteridine diphosphokinase, partial [Acidaminococcus fermentans]|uniref:2-amino-4-hydroxy-6- hydroxymethyldihydropteridine diphosphokinase n=1 Tax=Acidaminococcus fermentans TaxID=905 RepID=UPI0030808CCA